MMKRQVIIDGNNLLHAMFKHAVISSITRVAMVREIQNWTRKVKREVTIVFDGPPPNDGFDKPGRTGRIDIRYAAPLSADDVIVRMIHAAPHPDRLVIVSSDTAIGYEARKRRCLSQKCEEFIPEAFPDQSGQPRKRSRRNPTSPEPDPKIDPELASQDAEYWMNEFGIEDEDEPFDGFDAMRGL